MSEPFLSVVVPCFNEEAVLPEFHRRMASACASLGTPYEMVLVNDGSRDSTWETMTRLAAGDPHVVRVNLARNHGHQLALTAGLSVCRGERILVIDADLQDPPELLPAMMERLDVGADVVYGKRRRRQGESRFKLITASLFYRLIGALSSVPIARDTGDFRLMTRRVLDVLRSMPEQHRFIRGMISWIGFRQEPILYDRDARFAGETKYPLRKMWKLALDAITSFSTRPLHFAGTAGALLLLGAAVMLLTGLVRWAGSAAGEGGLLLAGWLTLVGAMQLLGLGIVGEYLGRLSEQSKGRPLFLIERVEPSPAAGVRPPFADRSAA
jgi:polyisoprenyl-phosphate glycosyltransferase